MPERFRAMSTSVPSTSRAPRRTGSLPARTSAPESAPRARSVRAAASPRSAVNKPKERSYSTSSSRCRARASAASWRARATSRLTRVEAARKQPNATQFDGASMANVPVGGRKKKFRQSVAATDAAAPTAQPPQVARPSTATRSRKPAVIALAPAARLARITPPRANGTAAHFARSCAHRAGCLSMRSVYSDLDLHADLDDPVRRQAEELRGHLGVAPHEDEEPVEDAPGEALPP